MILILLAVMFTALACVIAWYLATWALPVMVFVETFSFIHATEAGFLLSLLAAVVMALLSVGLVLLVLFKATNPVLCLLARAVFVIPAMIAGYAVVHGVTHEAIESAIGLKLLCGTAGLISEKVSCRVRRIGTENNMHGASIRGRYASEAPGQCGRRALVGRPFGDLGGEKGGAKLVHVSGGMVLLRAA